MEPKLALDGGEDGLDLYRRIIKEAYKYLNNNGTLALEIGYNQKDKVINLIKASNMYKDIYSKKIYQIMIELQYARKGVIKMSFSSDLREELIELKMWDNNSSLKQDEQLSRLLIREAFIKKALLMIQTKIIIQKYYLKAKKKQNNYKK